MKNNISRLEAARIELEKAKKVYAAAQAALSVFAKPFEEKVIEIQRDITSEEARLHSLKGELTKNLDNEDAAETIETEIEKSSKKLKRLQQRLELAQGWRGREESLKKLEDEVQTAYLGWQAAYGEFIERLKEEVLAKREAFIQGSVQLYAEMRTACEHVRFQPLTRKQLEIDWNDFIRTMGASPHWWT